MPAIDNPGIVINNAIFTDQSSTPTTPPTGQSRVFTKADGLYVVNDAGTVTGPFAIAGLSNPMTTAGDIIVASGSGVPGRLGIGANTTVLTSNGTTVTWAAGGGGSGGIGQVLSATKTDTFTSSAAATWTDITGLSVAITPASASSKIFITANINGTLFRPSQARIHARLVRDTTAISVGDAAGSRTRASMTIAAPGTDSINSGSIQFLDSPATASEVTYKVQFWQEGATYPLLINQTILDSDTASIGRYASSITVMEVL